MVVRKYGHSACSSVECRGDEEIAGKIVTCVQRNDFVFARIREIESLYNMTKDAQTDPLNYNEDNLDSNYIRSSTIVDKYIGQIWNELPANTMLMCESSHGDSMLASALLKKKSQSRSADKSTSSSVAQAWGPANEEQLSSAVLNARKGTAFVAIKRQQADKCVDPIQP